MKEELEKETRAVISALEEKGAIPEHQGLMTLIWIPGISTRASISLDRMHDELLIREQSQSPDDKVESWRAVLDKQDRSKWRVGEEPKLRTSRELATFIWDRVQMKSAVS